MRCSLPCVILVGNPESIQGDSYNLKSFLQSSSCPSKKVFELRNNLCVCVWSSSGICNHSGSHTTSRGFVLGTRNQDSESGTWFHAVSWWYTQLNWCVLRCSIESDPDCYHGLRRSPYVLSFPRTFFFFFAMHQLKRWLKQALYFPVHHFGPFNKILNCSWSDTGKRVPSQSFQPYTVC